MDYVFLDFETQSKVDIYKEGAAKYSADPSTSIICYSYAVGMGNIISIQGGRKPEIFIEFINRGIPFVCHNAEFEYMIWSKVWGEPTPKFICTKAMGLSCGMPESLKNLSSAVQGESEKYFAGARLISFFCSPKKDGSFNRMEDHPKFAKEFMYYCKKDVQACRTIFNALPKLSDKEQQLYELTSMINYRGLHIDRQAVEKAYMTLTYAYEKAVLEIQRLSGGMVSSPTQVKAIRNFIENDIGIVTNDLKSSTVNALLLKDLPNYVKGILEIRKEHSKSSTAKIKKMLDNVDNDNIIKNYLVYHGANTGRWSSRGVQFQNIPRGGDIDVEECISNIISLESEDFCDIYKSPISAISNCLRGFIVPEEGNVFLISDYVGIEARVLLWLAGQENILEKIVGGIDIYVDMAKKIYNDNSLTKEDKEQRMLGKQAVLGCGYGMGSTRFKQMCAAYKIEVSEDMSDKAVRIYRKTYAKVPKLWYLLGEGFRRAIKNENAIKVKGVIFKHRKRFMGVTLPSGRLLRYYLPSVKEEGLSFYSVNSQTKQFTKTTTYGGKICENVVQAIARDIMAEAMLKLEKEGYNVVLTIHDEIVCEVPKNSKYNTEGMGNIMCQAPKWAIGCPISTEGTTTRRYKK